MKDNLLDYRDSELKELWKEGIFIILDGGNDAYIGTKKYKLKLDDWRKLYKLLRVIKPHSTFALSNSSESVRCYAFHTSYHYAHDMQEKYIEWNNKSNQTQTSKKYPLGSVFVDEEGNKFILNIDGGEEPHYSLFRDEYGNTHLLKFSNLTLLKENEFKVGNCVVMNDDSEATYYKVIERDGNIYTIEDMTINSTTTKVVDSTEVELIMYEDAKNSNSARNKKKSHENATTAQTVYKIPKKNRDWNFEIGDKIAVDGLIPLQTITKITDEYVYYEHQGKISRKSKSYVKRFNKQFDKNIIKVGDIITSTTEEGFHVVTKIYTGGVICQNGIRYSFDYISEAYSTKRPHLTYTSYSCGTVEFNGDSYDSVDELKKVYGNVTYTENKSEYIKEHLDIMSHFGVDEVHEKDKSIREILFQTLEHPLNVAKKRWALLVGESGSGKTESAIEYCKRTNKEYVKLQGTAQLTVDDIIGYKSLTTGEYITSLLRDAVENGKVFILDEIDACNPNTLLVLNGLKQEYFQFPDKLVKVHKNFKFIGTANTLEFSESYNARQPMDTATKSRFKIIEYNMNPEELALRYGLKYIKAIANIERYTPREIEGMVLDMKIEDELKEQ